MDTGVGIADWTSDPMATTPPSSHSDWADFSSFSAESGQQSQKYIWVLRVLKMLKISIYMYACTFTV